MTELLVPKGEEVQVSTPEAPSWSLEDLEHQLVAASLADTDILEYVAVRYRGRLRGRLASLFTAANHYFNVTRGPMHRDALASILAQNEPDQTKHDDYLALFDALTAAPYTGYKDSDRRWFLHEYDRVWQINETGNVLAFAAEALRSGHESHGKKLMGADAAWQLISEARIAFSSKVSADSQQEEEITGSTEQARLDYIKATEAKYLGCPLSLPEVNGAIGGLKSGMMFIVAGFASEGKSFVMLNDAYSAWSKGKNVSLGTGEMTVTEYRARFIALHSLHLFRQGKVKEPIETIPIERGQLTPEHHAIFLQVLEDYKTNPAYGKFYLFKFPNRATPSYIFNKFAEYDQIVPLDMGVIDYLGLMASERNRVSRREELDDLIREVKAMALDFAGGRSLGLEVGYQTNRQSFERARAEGYYTATCFAESSEAEKSADAAMWILSQPQNPMELKCGFVKNRHGELGEPFYVQRNLAHGHLESMQSSRGTSGPGKGFDLLDT